MKERPILFSAPMIRAILENRKTQTRRIVKFPKWANAEKDADKLVLHNGLCYINDCGTIEKTFSCPHGIAKDKLWVRETWQCLHDCIDPETGYGDDIIVPKKIPKHNNTDDVLSDPWWRVIYKEDELNQSKEDRGFVWRPSIFMPRWASRITLEITDVRVERLKKISAADAMAEGIGHMYGYNNLKPAIDGIRRFAELWTEINGPDSWDENPFVWVISFKRI